MEYTGKNSLASLRAFIIGPCANAIREINEKVEVATTTIMSTVVSGGYACYRIVPNCAPFISINTATVEELQGLNKVGPARAASIVASRPFIGLDEANKVTGCDIVSANRGVIALNSTIVLSQDLHTAWNQALKDMPALEKERLQVEQAADDARESIRKLMANVRDRKLSPPRISVDVQRLLRLPATCSAENSYKRTWRAR